MHELSGQYLFKNFDGTVIFFGPGDAIRIWVFWPGIAHDVLAAYNDRCYHSPGMNEVFREHDLSTLLRGARQVEVINRAQTLQEVDRRIARAQHVLGVPWELWRANCQDTISWIISGKASSFQRDAVFGLVAGLGLLLVVLTAAEAAQHR